MKNKIQSIFFVKYFGILCTLSAPFLRSAEGPRRHLPCTVFAAGTTILFRPSPAERQRAADYGWCAAQSIYHGHTLKGAPVLLQCRAPDPGPTFFIAWEVQSFGRSLASRPTEPVFSGLAGFSCALWVAVVPLCCGAVICPLGPSPVVSPRCPSGPHTTCLAHSPGRIIDVRSSHHQRCHASQLGAILPHCGPHPPFGFCAGQVGRLGQTDPVTFRLQAPLSFQNLLPEDVAVYFSTAAEMPDPSAAKVKVHGQASSLLRPSRFLLGGGWRFPSPVDARFPRPSSDACSPIQIQHGFL